MGNIPNALDKVASLNGFYYEANDAAQSLGYEVKREVGLSAQEVEKVLPEVVLTTEERKPGETITREIKSVDYGKIVPVLIEAIKEQDDKITRLEALVETLINKLGEK